MKLFFSKLSSRLPKITTKNSFILAFAFLNAGLLLMLFGLHLIAAASLFIALILNVKTLLMKGGEHNGQGTQDTPVSPSSPDAVS